MARWQTAALGALGLLGMLLAAPPAGAQEGGLCESGPGPAPSVSLIVLASPERVRTLAASIRGVAVVHSDPKTVIFADGRVITADVARVGDHLTALGWAERRIEMTASFKPRASRPRRRG